MVDGQIIKFIVTNLRKKKPSLLNTEVRSYKENQYFETSILRKLEFCIFEKKFVLSEKKQVMKFLLIPAYIDLIVLKLNEKSRLKGPRIRIIKFISVSASHW